MYKLTVLTLEEGLDLLNRIFPGEVEEGSPWANCAFCKTKKPFKKMIWIGHRHTNDGVTYSPPWPNTVCSENCLALFTFKAISSE